MDERSERWRAVTESQFVWEREALAPLRAGLPDCEFYRAWANFEFVADDRAVYEVDALVSTPIRLWLLEVKSWPGPSPRLVRRRLVVGGPTWARSVVARRRLHGRRRRR